MQITSHSSNPTRHSLQQTRLPLSHHCSVKQKRPRGATSVVRIQSKLNRTQAHSEMITHLRQEATSAELVKCTMHINSHSRNLILHSLQQTRLTLSHHCSIEKKKALGAPSVVRIQSKLNRTQAHSEMIAHLRQEVTSEKLVKCTMHITSHSSNPIRHSLQHTSLPLSHHCSIEKKRPGAPLPLLEFTN